MKSLRDNKKSLSLWEEVAMLALTERASLL